MNILMFLAPLPKIPHTNTIVSFGIVFLIDKRNVKANFII